MLGKPVIRSILCLAAVASALPQSPALDASPLLARGRYPPPQCAVSKSSQPGWYQRNLKTVQTIYDFTVYPANLGIITQGGKAVPPGLFAPNATGRVSPVGNFTGFEDSIEYFFALAPVPQGPNGKAFYDAELVDFVSGCPSVAASLIYLRTGSVNQSGVLDKTKPMTTLSQVAFWHFNEKGEVDEYQAWIPNLQAWIKTSSGIDYTAVPVQKAVPSQLCPQIQKQCTGKNQQYDSLEHCAKELSEKPFGNFDEAWGDNLACRTIHLLLTLVRPDVHCPHVGPTGGGKCVDIDYSDDYFDDAQLYKAPIGSVFTCSGQLPKSQNLPAKAAQKALAQMAMEQAKKKKTPPVGAPTTSSTTEADAVAGQGPSPDRIGSSSGTEGAKSCKVTYSQSYAPPAH